MECHFHVSCVTCHNSCMTWRTSMFVPRFMHDTRDMWWKVKDESLYIWSAHWTCIARSSCRAWIMTSDTWHVNNDILCSISLNRHQKWDQTSHLVQIAPLMLAVLPYARGRWFDSRSRLLFIMWTNLCFSSFIFIVHWTSNYSVTCGTFPGANLGGGGIKNDGQFQRFFPICSRSISNFWANEAGAPWIRACFRYLYHRLIITNNTDPNPNEKG
jgi:hypothetical protein